MIRWRYQASIVLIFILVLISWAHVYAQTKSVEDSPRVSLELRNTRITDALTALFKFKKNANFVVESGSNAMVQDVRVVDVPFDTALRILVRAAGLTYRVVDGVYTIGLRQLRSVTSPPTPNYPPVESPLEPKPAEPKVTTAKIPLLYSDVYDVANLLMGQPGTRASSFAGGSGATTTGVNGWGNGANSGYGNNQYGSGYSSGYNGGYNSGYSYGSNSFSGRSGYPGRRYQNNANQGYRMY